MLNLGRVMEPLTLQSSSQSTMVNGQPDLTITSVQSPSTRNTVNDFSDSARRPCTCPAIFNSGFNLHIFGSKLMGSCHDGSKEKKQSISRTHSRVFWTEDDWTSTSIQERKHKVPLKEPSLSLLVPYPYPSPPYSSVTSVPRSRRGYSRPLSHSLVLSSAHKGSTAHGLFHVQCHV